MCRDSVNLEKKIGGKYAYTRIWIIAMARCGETGYGRGEVKFSSARLSYGAVQFSNIQ